MKKRGIGGILRVLTVFVIILTVVHTFVQIVSFGTGIPGLAPSGVQSLPLGFINLPQEVRIHLSNFSYPSKIMVGAEWVILASLLFITLRKKPIQKQEYPILLNISKAKSDTSTIKTDLDVLYSALKEKKSLKVSLVARSFNVEKDTVVDWCKILESANLASLYYPKFGEPELRLVTTAQ